MTACILALLLLLLSLTTAQAASPCERLLPVMATIRQGQQQPRMPRLTPEQETDWRSWNALCQDKPWPQRLHAILHPGTPYGQGWGAALGHDAPSSPSTTTTTTTCHGGPFLGYWCTSTTQSR
jgi:hypothetical protein